MRRIVRRFNENFGIAGDEYSPSIHELIAIVNDFDNILIGFLKNTPGIENSTIHRSWDIAHVNNLPRLNYFQLYQTLITLMRIISVFDSSQNAILAEETMKCLCTVMAFITREDRANLPHAVAELLYDCGLKNFSLQACILKYLCRKIIPSCFGLDSNEGAYNRPSVQNIPGIINLVFEFADDTSFHFELMETFLLFNQDLLILLRIAIRRTNGSTKVCGIQHLLHYWPHLSYSLELERGLITALSKRSIPCENRKCNSPSKTNFAINMVMDPPLAARCSGKSPPLYLCHACSQKLVVDEFPSKCFKVILPTDAANRCRGNLPSLPSWCEEQPRPDIIYSDVLQQYEQILPSILTRLTA
ncbi:unnamed protein product [Clavelina lepadiformis]|uniref:Uncharacterized protein n=1 Tax=Clavelina lepadiformis TaxID=159417 RepID=A0ABP0H1U7_CLALP